MKVHALAQKIGPGLFIESTKLVDEIAVPIKTNYDGDSGFVVSTLKGRTVVPSLKFKQLDFDCTWFYRLGRTTVFWLPQADNVDSHALSRMLEMLDSKADNWNLRPWQIREKLAKAGDMANQGFCNHLKQAIFRPVTEKQTRAFRNKLTREVKGVGLKLRITAVLPVFAEMETETDYVWGFGIKFPKNGNWKNARFKDPAQGHAGTGCCWAGPTWLVMSKMVFEGREVDMPPLIVAEWQDFEEGIKTFAPELHAKIKKPFGELVFIGSSWCQRDGIKYLTDRRKSHTPVFTTPFERSFSLGMWLRSHCIPKLLTTGYITTEDVPGFGTFSGSSSKVRQRVPKPGEMLPEWMKAKEYPVKEIDIVKLNIGGAGE